jgi:hypothetical protein
MNIDDFIDKLTEIRSEYGAHIYVMYNNSNDNNIKGLLSISSAEYKILKFPDDTLEIVEIK